MNFSSDNASGVCEEIMLALSAANQGAAAAYGQDDWTQELHSQAAAFFECPVAIFPVSTGTAANALALSAFVPPYGSIYCHRHAHIEEDECGAPALFTGGADLHLLDGADARIDAAHLSENLAAAGFGVEHHRQPAAVSVTQATEAGTVYDISSLAAITQAAHQYGLCVHMDGARFANACVAMSASPAEMTWRAGIDVLSFGATKNGAMAAEMVVFFDPEKAQNFRYLRKRGGHLTSKMRFLSAQLLAYLRDDLWRRNATHANACAALLAAGLAGLPDARLVHPVEANEVFVALPPAVIAGLQADGFIFHPWGPAADSVIRLVTAYDTDTKAVDHFIARAAFHSKRAKPALA